ncbi:MAG TPA: LPXTG cell wall anchor domain-containing protein, partial [Micromonosporaceae bacterium]|nr:LPXTG cell wall anchor domain-containing protein [Micromonosporaceae bacterium]
DRSNNSAEVQVEVVARSFDLVAVAFDVYAGDDTEPVELLPVAPGHRAWLRWFAVNRGSGGSRGGATRGVSYTVALPAHVTFAEHREGCAYSPDNRRMTCQDPDAVLARGTASGYVADPVRVVVDRLARGPVLVGGTVSAYALEQLTADAVARLDTAAGPRVKALTETQQEQLAEAATGGNAARYNVHVSVRQLAAGSGGGLPITGAQAGLVGVVGLAVLAAGGVLFVMARRRRLVLVTPDERSPTT